MSDWAPEKEPPGGPGVAQRVTNPANIREDAGLMPGLAQWVKDPAWSAAVAPTGPLAWALPCAAGAALKNKQQTKVWRLYGEVSDNRFF